MSVKKVYVYKTYGLPVYKVYPPVTILKKNDSMVLVNCADKDARWQVPAGVLEDKAIDEPVVHP